jgi:hypothetical protein
VLLPAHTDIYIYQLPSVNTQLQSVMLPYKYYHNKVTRTVTVCCSTAGVLTLCNNTTHLNGGELVLLPPHTDVYIYIYISVTVSKHTATVSHVTI